MAHNQNLDCSGDDDYHSHNTFELELSQFSPAAQKLSLSLTLTGTSTINDSECEYPSLKEVPLRRTTQHASTGADADDEDDSIILPLKQPQTSSCRDTPPRRQKPAEKLQDTPLQPKSSKNSKIPESSANELQDPADDCDEFDQSDPILRALMQRARLVFSSLQKIQQNLS